MKHGWQAMKVYAMEAGQRRLVGRAKVAADAGPVVVVQLSYAASVRKEHFVVGNVTHLPANGGLVFERAILLERGQPPDSLPGWQPLAPDAVLRPVTSPH